MWNSSIWPIDRTLSGATTLGQSGPWSDGNEWVLCIPQNSSITEASPSDYLVSYPGYRLGEFYPSAEMSSEYSSSPADWAKKNYSCLTGILVIMTSLKSSIQAICLQIIYIWYKYKQDLAENDPHKLIRHEIKPTNQPYRYLDFIKKKYPKNPPE